MEQRDREWQFAVQLARMPDVWATLLERHTVDAAGRCTACTSQVEPAARWPCVLYAAAARARRIATEPR